MMKRLILAIVVLFNTAGWVSGQKYDAWYKMVNKYEGQYHLGKYLMASEGSKRYIKRQIKKGEHLELLPVNRMMRAKYRSALGLRKEAMVSFLTALSEWESMETKLPDSVQIVTNLLIYATAHELNRLQLANTYLSRAQKFVNDASDPIGYWNQMIRIKRIKLLMDMYNFIEASALIDEAVAWQKKQVRAADRVYNIQKQAFEEKKLKKKEYRKRYSEYGKVSVLKADIAREKGAILLADSLYMLNFNNIFSTWKKSDDGTIANWYGQTLIDLEERNPKAGKTLRKIRNRYANKVHIIVPNEFYFEIFENELIANLIFGDYSRFNSGASQYKREAVKNFSKKSVHWFRARYLYELGDLYKDNYQSYNKHMSALYEEMNDYFDTTDLAATDFLFYLAQAKEKMFDLNAAELLYFDIINRAQLNTGDTSIITVLAKLKLGQFYAFHKSAYVKADSLFGMYFDQYIRLQFDPFHPEYVKLLNAYAKALDGLEQYDKALELFSEAANIQMRKFGKYSSESGEQLLNLAKVQVKLGDYPGAEKSIKTAKTAFERSKKTKTETYILILQAYGELLQLNGDYVRAEENLDKAFDLAKRTMKKDELVRVSTRESLAELYINMGRYDDARNILVKTIAIREEKEGKEHVDLIRPYSLLGKLDLVTGNMVGAERNISKSAYLAKSILGDTSLVYIKQLILLGDVYANMGNDEKAIEKYLMAQYKTESKFGKNYLLISDILIKIVQVDLRGDFDPKEELDLLNRAALIIHRNLSEHHPKNSEVSELKALVYIKQKQYNEALVQLQAANLIYTSTYGANHVKTADNRMMVASLYYHKSDYVNALRYYDMAIKSYEVIFNKEHPKYVKALSKKGQTYYAQGNYKEATEMLMQSTQMYLQYIEEYFPTLSELEKARYWRSIRNDFELFNSLALKYYSKNPDVLDRMYDNQLATKAILLNSSIKMKERILKYGDPVLVNKYKEWIDKRELLSRSLSMNAEELEENNINRNQLENEINTLERELSQSAVGFAKNYGSKRVTWLMVRNQLETNEAAIEIIRFNYFDKNFTDSVIYAALIITPNSKNHPEIVILPNGKELEGRWFSFYRNNFIFKKEDKKSYSEYWQLFEPKLVNIKKIYFSGDGVYNQINPESFRKQDGSYLIDSYKFYFVSNTRDLVDASKSAKEDKSLVENNAVLIGNPDFNMGASGPENTIVGSIDPLPGAEVEVKEVAELLKNSNWNVQVYTGKDATEEVLRSLDSPRILHIATHGFFLEDQYIANNEDGILVSDNDVIENPLLKSGLLLSGATELLKSGNVYEFNREDGILTAYEAMNLQLDNTEVVILSACETGRGEVRAGEGVYGLQRSFLVAGANNVIMSLFKIDDVITRELIERFYEEWIRTGDKRQALIIAKKAIMEKYKDPYYWGAFVLIGLD